MMNKSRISCACAILLGLLLSPLVEARYNRDQPMAMAELNGIDIAYTVVGDSTAPPVLMVMGLHGFPSVVG